MDDKIKNLEQYIDNLNTVLYSLNKKKEEVTLKINKLQNELKSVPEQIRRKDIKNLLVAQNNNLLRKIDIEIKLNTNLRDKLIKQINDEIDANNVLENRIQRYGESKDADLEDELNKLVEEHDRLEELKRLEEEEAKRLAEEELQKRIIAMKKIEEEQKRSLMEEEQMRLAEEKQREREERNNDLFGKVSNDDFISDPILDEKLNKRRKEKEEEKNMNMEDNLDAIRLENQLRLQNEAKAQQNKRLKEEQDLMFNKQVKKYEQTKKRKQLNEKKTRKNKPGSIEMYVLPENEDLNETIVSNNSSNSNNNIPLETGYSDTLIKPVKQPQVISNRIIKPDIICPKIYKNGKNVTRKYFFPSEFPNLTNIKNMDTVKKGGYRTKRRKRRYYKGP
jgi:hypothetical protein